MILNQAKAQIEQQNCHTLQEDGVIEQLDGMIQTLEGEPQQQQTQQRQQATPGGCKDFINAPGQAQTRTPSNKGGVDTLQPKAPMGGYHKGNVPPVGLTPPATAPRDPNQDNNL